ncbi:hypothetical protein [Amycolatopsis sp. NPDC098790]|uniref:hypothetical protein n=1 Tax=Amycolatopsis sp. NPDC098790 TaxID=3363939 RepID=UPI0037FA7F39
MQTVLISVLTSALVTLLIEYFAKPSLEVRKDRLLARARVQRECLVTIELLSTTAGNIRAHGESHQLLEVKEILAKELDEQSIELIRQLTHLGVQMPKSVRPTLDWVSEYVDRLRLSIRREMDEVDAAEDVPPRLILDARFLVDCLTRITVVFTGLPRWIPFRIRFGAQYALEDLLEIEEKFRAER